MLGRREGWERNRPMRRSRKRPQLPQAGRRIFPLRMEPWQKM